MKVVVAFDNWVLTRMWKELRYVKEFPDLTYFINYARYTPTEGVTAGLFTHLEPATEGAFKNAAEKLDIAIAMSEKTKKDVLKYRDQCEVIEGATDFRKKLKFGVAGRTYKSGRKGEYLIKNMVDAGYDVIGLGEGWPCPCTPDDTNTKYTTDTREKFYSQIDYLIQPSLIEGGPLPVIDALGLGVPVITSDVGWAWDYSTIHYETGSWESLKHVLERLTPPLWSEWKEKHLDFFRQYYEKRG